MAVQPKSVHKSQAGSCCWLACAVVLTLAGCGSSGPDPAKPTAAGPHFKVGQPYQINGQWYYPRFVTEYAGRLGDNPQEVKVTTRTERAVQMTRRFTK